MCFVCHNVVRFPPCSVGIPFSDWPIIFGTPPNQTVTSSCVPPGPPTLMLASACYIVNTILSVLNITHL